MLADYKSNSRILNHLSITGSERSKNRFLSSWPLIWAAGPLVSLFLSCIKSQTTVNYDWGWWPLLSEIQKDSPNELFSLSRRVPLFIRRTGTFKIIQILIKQQLTQMSDKHDQLVRADVHIFLTKENNDCSRDGPLKNKTAKVYWQNT